MTAEVLALPNPVRALSLSSNVDTPTTTARSKLMTLSLVVKEEIARLQQAQEKDEIKVQDEIDAEEKEEAKLEFDVEQGLAADTYVSNASILPMALAPALHIGTFITLKCAYTTIAIANYLIRPRD